ncbi:MAG: Ig domain-containing protein, partial [Acidobacteriia bacterium]|nr:Ig domain-containing protein [Terriglobia bacterium]
MSLAVSAQIQDFAIDTSGPHHVVQGHYMFFNATGRILAGTEESGTVPSVSGLPPGATAEFVNMLRFCCSTTLYSITGNIPIKISTSSSTPAGTYPVQVILRTREGVQRSSTYTIYVDPVPSLIQKPGTYFPPDTPLASLAKWKSNMVTYGRKHCTAANAGQYSMYTVGYYDGTRIYYQIADLTGDSSFNACADLVYGSYSKYVNDNKGAIPGYQEFPHGIAMRFQRTGDVAARQTLTALRTGGAYSNWPNVASIIDWGRSREVSYAIETNLVDRSLGGVPNPYFQDLIEALFGQFDQWFVSKSATYVQPFMVALAAEALIQYWDVTHDPRVPPTLQMAADQVWAQSWDPSSKLLRYWEEDGTFALYSDLNLLLAPMYGWVYQRTGAQIYRDQGDQLFNAGVAGAWLDGGKQFSQNYRWSQKYVDWRTLAGPTLSVAFTSPTTGSPYTSSNPSITIAGTAFGQNVTQVTWTSDRGGSGTAAGTNNWSASSIALQSGSNQITVTARNSAGAQASVAIVVTYTPSTSPQDTSAPTIAITSPTSSSTFSTSSNAINLGGTASAIAGVTQVTWVTSRGASGTATGTTSWTISGLVVPSGSTTVTVTAHDAAGNVASRSLNVSYTPSPNAASIVITSPTSQPTFYASQNTITLNGNASGNITQISWVADQGGQGQATGTTNWTASGIGLRKGANRITVTAIDVAGNPSSAMITVMFNSPPAITTASLPAAQVGKPYAYRLTAVGGAPPFTWQVAPLPGGFSLSGDGLIIGTPVRAGTSTLNITLRDSVQAVTTATVSLQVGDGLVLVSAASLTPGPVAPESWAAAFGSQLADGTASMPASPVPTKLGDSTVMVRDANGVER